ncbi:MAG: BolA family protein, partial [Pseudomonadota bacterium]
MSAAARMTQTLTEAFSPEHLEVRDDSERHRGHGGWREGGETHFHLIMTSSAFAGQNRVARQRAVNRALQAEFDAGLHALSMELKAPGE